MANSMEDKREVPFAMVEKEVLRDPTLSAQAKALYALLICYGPNRIFPGQERLSKEMGVSRPTVRKWLDELKKHGLVTWQTRKGRSHKYQLLGPKYKPPVKPVDTPVNTSLQPPVNTSLHDRDLVIETQDQEGAPKRTGPSKAISIFRQEFNTFPKKKTWPDIDTVVGDTEDNLRLWARVCHQWQLKGYYKFNLTGLLECFQKGGVNGGAPRNNGTQADPDLAAQINGYLKQRGAAIATTT